ncbi:lysosome membrane protein 2 [Drosophila obscura]|uniref:lysosome membrane protein 2 n=1 Tax=Drosophila obscura TaxID=7282 RepID=UPI001BB2C89F|nr:lysosome membrane protein 2 [Drosophila obscura]XP_022218032.2 lysosome membrane protein 2 [Drosophila obscura]
MGLEKHYLRYGRTARDHILDWATCGRGRRQQQQQQQLQPQLQQTQHQQQQQQPLQQQSQPSQGSSTATGRRSRPHVTHRGTPLSMLISHGVKISNNRLAVIIIGIVTLILGILLTSIPWLDYFILKNLRLWNDTLSYHYWQRPGVIRLTKVYIYNVTNPDGFLSGEKPKLQEVGPFVYREDMEKVNVKFHENNYTVSYQHKKILQFVPELSIDKNTPIVTPNIPLLTLTSLSPKLGYLLSKTISVVITAANFKPFINVTADQLVFGYDDALVSLAHRFYPKHMRPMERMGLLLGRNGTLTEVSTIKTGYEGMDQFGYIDSLNGINHLPHWNEEPCTSVAGSEGSFFPPRDITKSEMVYIYDKDLCRIIPLKYDQTLEKDGIAADLFRLPNNSYGDSAHNPENKCFDSNEYEPVRGLQNISPCQYGAPVYISNPHFYDAHPDLLDSVEGLEPNREKHETYFKIQPKLGVPLEGKVRIQLNLKVTRAKDVYPVRDFRDFVFPVMWLEEGISELTPAIKRWIYLATVIAPNAVPIGSYLMIVGGASAVIFSFVRAYQNFVFARDPSLEILEMGRRSLRRGSSFIAHQQHRLLLHHRDSYSLLRHGPMAACMGDNEREDAQPIIDGSLESSGTIVSQGS